MLEMGGMKGVPIVDMDSTYRSSIDIVMNIGLEEANTNSNGYVPL